MGNQMPTVYHKPLLSGICNLEACCSHAKRQRQTFKFLKWPMIKYIFLKISSFLTHMLNELSQLHFQFKIKWIRDEKFCFSWQYCYLLIYYYNMVFEQKYSKKNGCYFQWNKKCSVEVAILRLTAVYWFWYVL